MKKLNLIVAIMAMMISPMIQAQHDEVAEDSIVGMYLDSLSNKIEVFQAGSGDIFLGKIVELKEPYDPPTSTRPLLDKHNPREILRDREVKGITFLTGLKFDINEWEKGSYYDYQTGKTFDCKMMFITDERGKVKLKIIPYTSTGGDRTTYWTKLN